MGSTTVCPLTESDTWKQKNLIHKVNAQIDIMYMHHWYFIFSTLSTVTCVSFISIKVFLACPIFFMSMSALGVEVPRGVMAPNGVFKPPNFCRQKAIIQKLQSWYKCSILKKVIKLFWGNNWHLPTFTCIYYNYYICSYISIILFY